MKNMVLVAGLLLFLASGCAATEHFTQGGEKILERPFESKINLCMGEKEYQGSLKYDEGGTVQLSLHGEQLTLPTNFESGEESFFIRIGESFLKLPSNAALPNSAVEEIRRALLALRNGEASKEGEQEKITAQSFEIYLEDGVFTRLNTPNTTVFFESVAFLK